MGRALALVLAMALIGGGLLLARGSLPPGTLAFVPPTTIAPGGTVGLHPTVAGIEVPVPAGWWLVDPPSLGSVDGTSTFRAGPKSGSGRITMSVGGASATTLVTIRCAERVERGAYSFDVNCAGPGDVYLEHGIPDAEVSAILRAIAADVPQVERDYARPFAVRPLLYVMATDTSFAGALAGFLAEGSRITRGVLEADGVYLTSKDIIAVNWAQSKRILPLTTIRHELAHKMMSELVGPRIDEIPAWVDEGSARIAETSVAGSEWLGARERAYAGSLAATGQLFTLAELTDRDTWTGRVGAAGDYQYSAATQAVMQLRADLGLNGVRRILELVAGGRPFEDAYATVAGKPFASFASAYATRTYGLFPSYPGILAARDTPRGPGLSLLLYGFPSSSTVTLTLTGPRDRGRSVEAVSTYGSGIVIVGPEIPAGTYQVVATAGSLRASITVTKAD